MKSFLSDLLPFIVVKEWMDCGEFKNTDTIIVIGNRFHAVVVSLLFRKSGKKIYYCSEMIEKYRYRKKTKWIIFDNSLKKKFPQNSYDVLVIPVFDH